MEQLSSGAVPIPPKHLFTWVDVDEHLTVLAEAGLWPNWLRAAESWWDGLELTAAYGVDIREVTEWLDRAFGTGSVSQNNGVDLVLRLDSPGIAEVVGLPIVIRYETAQPVAIARIPVLRDRRITDHLSDSLPRPADDRFPNEVQLLAFHSFKGGVGRTVHAVAFADAVARRGHRVLLIDADLEAPGISWMYKSQGGALDFSYEDFLCLLHGSEDGGSAEAIGTAAAYLPNQQVGRYAEPGGITIIPSTRRSRLGPPRIGPADLLTQDRSPYFLTESISALAVRVGADIVVIDLRAGASELSAPVLLDPRVQRVFVTSMSHQSLVGTKDLVRQLGRRAPTLQGKDPASSVVITQFRTDAHKNEVDRECDEISSALFDALIVRDEDGDSSVVSGVNLVDTEILSTPLRSPFREELLALPSSWDAVIKVIDGCGVAQSMQSLFPVEVRDGSEISSANEGVPDYTLLRKQLEKTARPLIYAEKEGMSSGSGFLVTESLMRILSDHRTELPLALVVGAKGAGKTFMYAKACVARTWDNFARQSGIGGVQLAAPIVPVLESDSLEPGELTTQDLRDVFLRESNGTGVIANTSLEIKDRLRKGVERCGEDEHAWRRLWLECLAVAAGVWTGAASPEEELASLAKRSQAIFIIDGLEDLLQSIDSGAKRAALHVLLTDVLSWLRSLRGQPLGLIIFVRQDLVTRAIRQNSGQLLARYEPYALRWDKEEALRLALWVAVRAGAVPGVQVESDVTGLNYDEIVDSLIPLWGWKMGTEKSKEARSHLWVPAALGDFKDQVQARDVVVFLAEAAKGSISQTSWDDRVLVPSAMRRALLACSTNKIDSIRQENQDVGDLLGRLQEVPHSVTVPFELDEVRLSVDDANFLVESGVFARGNDGRFWVAEIYRHGLGFGSERRAKVLWRR